MKTNLLTVTSFLWLCTETCTSAADRFWTNAFNGDFLTAVNWSPNIVPAAADNANFTNPIFPIITWSATRTNANALLNGTSGGFQQVIGTNSWLLTNSYVLGQNAGSTSAVIHLSGELRVTNAAGTGRLVIGQNGRGLYSLQGPAASVVADQLFATNNSIGGPTNSVLLLTAGSLTTLRGSEVGRASGFAFGTGAGSRAVWNMLGGTNRFDISSSGDLTLGAASNAQVVINVSGAGTLLTNTGRFVLGNPGVSNSINVFGGARLTSRGAEIGFSSAASNNVVTVSGTNTEWNARASNLLPILLHLGAQSSGNRLLISGGAKLRSLELFVGAFAASGSNNLLMVTDPGSVITNESQLEIGGFGGANRLVVSNGASLFSLWSRIAGQPSAGNNSALVAGTNSVWQLTGLSGEVPNSIALSIGGISSGNSLVVSNGGAVHTHASMILDNASQVIITGAGSTVSNENALRIGENQANSSMLISNGGLLRGGVSFGSTSNLLTVTGTGSTINGSSILMSGLGNTMVVSNGAKVFTTSTDLGFGNASSNNLVWLTGSGSTWSNQSSIRVGRAGNNTTLVVSNGAALFSAALDIGELVGSASNRLAVTDGNVTVTNGAETGTLDVRRGELVFSGGTITADWLFVTNNGAGFTNSIFDFNHGNLTTLKGVAINQTTSFSIGSTPNQTATWNIMDGTNTLVSASTVLGTSATARGVVTVTGPSTVWSNSSTLTVGSSDSSCLLIVSNGARVNNTSGTIGLNRTNNQVWVTGAGSVWSNSANVFLGLFGPRNLLIVSNGGTVFSQATFIGDNPGATNNLAMITGTNSTWRSSSINFGDAGGRNSLVISNAGTVSTSFLTVGVEASSTNNFLNIHGGRLVVTNVGRTGRLDIRRGTNRLNSGVIEADRLLLTNVLGAIQFNGGTLISHGITNNNGNVFGVGIGNGAGPAILHLAGSGQHFFGDGLSINNSGSLIGNGTIVGNVVIQLLGTLSPGTSVGRLVFSNSPALNGNTQMEVSKDASVLTNDQVQVMAPLTYSGALVVSKVGPTALTAGNEFPLFSATSYGGAFNSLTLPALDHGLMWTNKLLINGSIQVVPFTPPRITSLTLSGTSFLFSGSGGSPGGTYHLLTTTNLALPLPNWTAALTNQFDWLGNFTITNAVLGEPQRFYTLKIP